VNILVAHVARVFIQMQNRIQYRTFARKFTIQKN